jgi:peptidoglycan/LPS O-acetylase OafA/YrhL
MSSADEVLIAARTAVLENDLQQVASADPTYEPVWLWHGNIPSLNGLRAISILIVIISHLGLRPETSRPWLPHAGEMGVEMFFVISGFLITLLLLREHRRTQAVSLKHFYLRRSFRILPAYAFFLLTVFVLKQAGESEVPPRWWAAALTYTSSFLSRGDWVAAWDLSHTWSLSVEEHFYLIWPCLFLFAGLRGAFVAALACVLLTPWLRFALGTYLGYHIPALDFFSPTRMDAISAGCCLAFLASLPGFQRWTRLSGPGALAVVAAGLALLVLPNAMRPSLGHFRVFNNYQAYAANSFRPVIMAGMVWACLRSDPSGVLGKVLNARFLAFIGVISYSLYLWQQLFLNPFRSHWICLWPMNVLATLLAALFSYWVIELPFLRLKERYKC